MAWQDVYMLSNSLTAPDLKTPDVFSRTIIDLFAGRGKRFAHRLDDHDNAQQRLGLTPSDNVLYVLLRHQA